MTKDKEQIISLMEDIRHKYEEIDIIQARINKSCVKKQDSAVQTYLHELFRKPNILPTQIDENVLPDVYVLTHFTELLKGWYDEKKDEFIIYQSGFFEGRGSRVINKKDIFGWCYARELFPNKDKI